MPEHSAVFRLDKEKLNRLFDVLKQQGYLTIAPIESEGAIKWGEISSSEELPWGNHDFQKAGFYRLDNGDTKRCFDVVNGPQSLKSLTFVSREQLSTVKMESDGLASIQFYPSRPEPEKKAVIGVRSCDLAALKIQEKVLSEGQYSDPFFQSRRDSLFIVSVNCTRAAETCFCASMNTGPKAESGFDLAMTEMDDLFLIEAGSDKGRAALDLLSLQPSDRSDIDRADEAIQRCAESQRKGIDQQGLPQALYEASSHPHWDDVASRCLSCSNCTMVCPTCFCHAVEEEPSLDRSESARFRVWDSCFSPEHGYIHGKNMRPTTRERYRMWMMHKLGAWIEQFGSSGCVGCGRCTTWCPAAIDFVEEYRLVRDEGGRSHES